MRALIIEDDTGVAAAHKRALEEKAFAVDVATDGNEGNALLEANSYDVIIIDIGLPLMDGDILLQNFRRRNKETPVITISGHRNTTRDKLQFLEKGAYVHLDKAQDSEEVVATYALACVTGKVVKPVGGFDIEIGALQIDTSTTAVKFGGRHIKLSDLEYRVLLELAREGGSYIKKEEIAARVRGSDAGGDGLVDQIPGIIQRLRRDKFGDDRAFPNRYGKGYCVDIEYFESRA